MSEVQSTPPKRLIQVGGVILIVIDILVEKKLGLTGQGRFIHPPRALKMASRARTTLAQTTILQTKHTNAVRCTIIWDTSSPHSSLIALGGPSTSSDMADPPNIVLPPSALTVVDRAGGSSTSIAPPRGGDTGVDFFRSLRCFRPPSPSSSESDSSPSLWILMSLERSKKQTGEWDGRHERQVRHVMMVLTRPSDIRVFQILIHVIIIIIMR